MNNAWQQFCGEFPSLDIDYMSDRRNGELYVDGGITLQPDNPDKPLVGLLKLEYMEACLGASGWLAGSHHRLNTLNHYGGIQTEMSQKRSERTHLVFVSTYNLAYEVVRKMDNKRDMFDAKDAYTLGQAYIDEKDKLIQLYDAAAKGETSYGVRLEFRVGIKGLNEVLLAIDNRIKRLVQDQAVLWLPASTWFTFLINRITAIFDAQVHIYNLGPPNMGVLTGVLTHMLQSVVFTPPRTESHVNLSLATLRFATTTDRFGMFFLHDWNIRRAGVLEDILQVDDVSVLQALGLKIPRQQAVPIPVDQIPTEAFPCGPEPAWGLVKNTLQDEPWKILQEWTWPPTELDSYRYASPGTIERTTARLFILMTAQIYALLHELWLVDGKTICPSTLEEAMECWTWRFMYTTVRKIHFLPCNAGLQGPISEQKVDSFFDRHDLYFPTEPLPNKSRWQDLTVDPGYIAEYETTCSGLVSSDVEKIRDGLATILSFCQCLPESNKADIWIVRQNRVRVLANPRYYRLRRIGSEAGTRGSDRRANTYTGKIKLKQKMLELKGFSGGVAQQAVKIHQKQMNAKRTGKAKGRRAPPKK